MSLAAGAVALVGAAAGALPAPLVSCFKPVSAVAADADQLQRGTVESRAIESILLLNCGLPPAADNKEHHQSSSAHFGQMEANWPAVVSTFGPMQASRVYITTGRL